MLRVPKGDFIIAPVKNEVLFEKETVFRDVIMTIISNTAMLIKRPGGIMEIIRKSGAIAFVCMMLACAWPVISTNASAGNPLTVTWYDNVTVRDASGGEAGIDYWIADNDMTYSYNVGAQWAYAKVWQKSPVSAARVYAGVYKEIRIADGKFGYYTATMNGQYAGRVAIGSIWPVGSEANIWWGYRVTDLSIPGPNNVITQVEVKYLHRTLAGSETIPVTSFSKTLSWYSYGGERIGLEAFVWAEASSSDPTAFPYTVRADAYLVNNKYAGVWFSSINIQAPCPGPGCVLEGTPIMMADGTYAPVETLKKNSQIMGYDTATGSYVTESVTMNKKTVTYEVLVINEGLLTVTTTNQPIWARHGTFTGWVVNPIELQLGWEILNATTGDWVEITNLEVKEGTFTVYDVGATSPDNYIANGILLDRKPIKR